MRYILLAIMLMTSYPVYAFRTGMPARFTNLDDKVQLRSLNEFINSLWDITNGRYQMDIVTTNPDGSRKGDTGEMVLFNDSGTYYLAINVDGGTTWRSILLQDLP